MVNLLFSTYQSALTAAFVLAVLMVIQFVVADVASIRAKHVPGMPVTSGHGDFFFRATRAYANTSENIGLFLLAFLLCVLAGADPKWTAGFVWLFAAGRAGHMACYYADLRTPRSIAFGIGALGMLGLIVEAGAALLK